MKGIVWGTLVRKLKTILLGQNNEGFLKFAKNDTTLENDPFNYLRTKNDFLKKVLTQKFRYLCNKKVHNVPISSFDRWETIFSSLSRFSNLIKKERI